MPRPLAPLAAAFLGLFVTAAAAQTDVHSTGAVRLQVFDNGSVGARAGTGAGFDLFGQAGLFDGQLFVGTGPDRLSGQAYSGADWTPGDPVAALPASGPFDQVLRATFSDAAAPAPLGVTVTQTTLSSSTTSFRQFVVVQYTLQNTTAVALDGVYAGLFADFDVADAQNLGAFDPARKLLYVYRPGQSAPYFGTVLLGSTPLAGWSVDLADTGPVTDARVFAGMTTPGTTPAGSGDRVSVLGAGPYAIPAGGAVTVRYALVAGSSLADLQGAASAARGLFPDLTSPGFTVVADGSFETGTPNASWTEASTTFGTPICADGSCPRAGGVGPHTGSSFVLFGGDGSAPETASVEQVVTVPAGVAELSFYLQIPTLPPTSQFETFIVTRNSAGPLTPPEYAALALAPALFPNVPGLTANPVQPTEGQQVGPAEWLIHQGSDPLDATYATFADRVTRGGENYAVIREHDYEWRFTGTSVATLFLDPATSLTVPFELWDVGTTPDDASDDVRLIPSMVDQGTPEAFDLSRTDHAVSGGTNDPFTDRIYWYRPRDESPGQAGYEAYVAAVEAGTYTRAGELEVFARTVLVNLNGGPVSSGTYNQALPEPGTVFRIVAGKPSETAAMTVSVDGVPLATYTSLDQPLRSGYRFVTLPASAFADGGARRVRFEVAAAAGSPVRMALDDVALRVWPAGTHAAVTPGAVDFGDVPVGTAATRTVTVLNDGTTAVDLDSVSYVGNDAVTASAVGPATLAPGESRTVTLTFAPTDPTLGSGMFGVLAVSANAPGFPVEVEVSGTGVNPVAGEAGAGAGRSTLMAAPNPARGASRVRLTVEDGQDVAVVVYDVTGRLVRTLFSGPTAAGQPLDLVLDGSSLSPGVYVVRASGPTVSLTRLVTVVR